MKLDFDERERDKRKREVSIGKQSKCDDKEKKKLD